MLELSSTSLLTRFLEPSLLSNLTLSLIVLWRAPRTRVLLSVLSSLPSQHRRLPYYSLTTLTIAMVIVLLLLLYLLILLCHKLLLLSVSAIVTIVMIRVWSRLIVGGFGLLFLLAVLLVILIVLALRWLFMWLLLTVILIICLRLRCSGLTFFFLIIERRLLNLLRGLLFRVWGWRGNGAHGISIVDLDGLCAAAEVAVCCLLQYLLPLASDLAVSDLRQALRDGFYQVAQLLALAHFQRTLYYIVSILIPHQIYI